MAERERITWGCWKASTSNNDLVAGFPWGIGFPPPPGWNENLGFVEGVWINQSTNGGSQSFDYWQQNGGMWTGVVRRNFTEPGTNNGKTVLAISVEGAVGFNPTPPPLGQVIVYRPNLGVAPFVYRPERLSFRSSDKYHLY